MSENYVVAPAKVRSALRKELASRAGWTLTSGIRDNSYLYKAQNPRTTATANPPHFGFVKSHSIVADAANDVGRQLVGATILTGHNLLSQGDRNLPTFGDLAQRVHLRLNGYLIDVFGRTVLYSIYEAIGQNLTISDPAPSWVGDVAFLQFITVLSQELAVAFPSRPPPVLDPVVVQRLREKESVENLRDTLLTRVVKQAINARQFETPEVENV